MMALTNSFPGPSGLTDTTEARKALAGLVENNLSGKIRTGIFPANSGPLVTARADMQVDVAAFQAVADQFGGAIFFSNDGSRQLDAALVSPGAGTNFYVVYAKQNESVAPGTDANNSMVLTATLSTSSLAAARAALPTGAVELATVQMPTGKTATNASGVTITQTFQYTTAEGGVVRLRNQADEDAWSPSAGSLAWRLDVGVLRITSTSGAWGNLNGVAVSGSLAGTAYDGISPIIYKMGTAAATTDGSSILIAAWPGGAFPNGLISAQFTPGDAAATGKMTINAASTTTNMRVQMLSSTGASVASSAQRVNFFAAGW